MAARFEELRISSLVVARMDVSKEVMIMSDKACTAGIIPAFIAVCLATDKLHNSNVFNSLECSPYSVGPSSGIQSDSLDVPPSCPRLAQVSTEIFIIYPLPILIFRLSPGLLIAILPGFITPA
jgi:hypothetical protein